MGAILVFVAIIGTKAWFQVNRLWQETKELYEHTLTVRSAVDKLDIDIMKHFVTKSGTDCKPQNFFGVG
jgi:hypothetical protein